ncbi:hypothetical protein [Desulfitobacterium chlororespirans]|uniref:Uncharacterized protein n=1 Tax=Desulfitobacterium chlororespirans DSM 11544 TaxID=1121395 RepID=A0A1M7UZS7_9FIRM|nr:hypothetical protein [Desulfitobacterium chlororespirans]SHN88454.1 hypothetical protein SAMN02745215_05345 [Desulfitobacterium chlororespirans DSM 11544]
MGKNLKGAFIYLGIIFISMVLVYKLPQDSYSMIQYIIKPIRFENSVLNLSGLIPLIMLFIGIRGLCRLEWFADKSKLLITIIVLILVMPAMGGTLDIAKTIYLSNLNNQMRSIDFKDIDIKVSSITDNDVTLNIKLELTDYREDMSDFQIRMYLPDSWTVYFDKEFIDFEESYKSFGRRRPIIVDKEISVQLADGITRDNVFDSQWYWETFEFELFNNIDSSKLIYHGT